MFTHASPSLLDAESGENKYDELRKVSDEGVCVCACMWLSLSLRQFMCVAAHDCRSLFLA
jgi:hypothetical protein